jgi:SAM-dependent methyltransferase
VRRRHFETLRPICPRCRGQGLGDHPLRLAAVFAETDEDVLSGVLHCPDAACLREFPILDGIPLLVPDMQRYVADNLFYLNARDDLPPALASLIGDCAGSGSVFDVGRQHLSIYAWDGFAEFDPDEARGGIEPGAVARCLGRALGLIGGSPGSPAIDVGCAVGRSTLELANHVDGLVLGVDLSIPMLRLAREVLRDGIVRYPRRRVGVVYDVREFPVSFAGSERVDFWACDALALPFADGAFAQAVALNVLDCVASPLDLLTGLARVLRSGSSALLATPYDWSPGATAAPAWIGGHSQRGDERGASEPLLRRLLRGGGHPLEIRELRLVRETEHFPWHARLHDRAIVSYDVHVLALESVKREDRAAK